MERFKFFKRHERELAPLIDKNEDFDTVSPERFETHIFAWEREGATQGKRVMLEASEPIAHQIVEPLIGTLQADERMRALTLLTDNFAGKKFSEEAVELHLNEIRDEGKPVLAEIPGDTDVTLVVTEPNNSPDKVALYAGKSVYGTSHGKLYHLIDGLPGTGTRALFEGENAGRMDEIDTVFVTNELSKDILAASLPSMKDKIEVIDSPLLASKKEMFPKSETREEKRAELLSRLLIPDSAVVVFYSGFPSSDYEPATEGKTLNQKTFLRTLESIKRAAEENPEKHFALIVREHPRAKGAGDQIEMPTSTPENLTVVTGEGPDYSYDEIANSSDFIVCQSTSSEVTLAKYRGARALVSGYTGMQEELNKNIFGEAGLEGLKHSPEIVYVSEGEEITKALEDFDTRRDIVAIPDGAFDELKERILKD